MLNLRMLLRRTSELVTRRGASRERLARPDAASADPAVPPTALVPRRLASGLASDGVRRLRRLFQPSIVAASLDGASLRLVSLDGRRVVSWARLPIEPRLSLQGHILDPSGLGEAIDDTFTRLDLSRQRVAWALPADRVVARVLEIPEASGPTLDQLVAEEAEVTLGLAPDEHFLFWQRREGRIRRRNVFVLAVPRATILAALDALEIARIHPYTMDLRPLALARAIGRSDAIVLHLGEGSLDVAIISRGIPTLLRTVPVPELPEAAPSCLLDELDRALTSSPGPHPALPLLPEAPIFLVGRLATDPTLVDQVCSLSGRPIGKVPIPIPGPADFPMTEYLVHLGLALKES